LYFQIVNFPEIKYLFSYFQANSIQQEQLILLYGSNFQQFAMQSLLHYQKLLLHLIRYAISAFSALTLLVGRQEGPIRPVKTEWWGAGMVICLKQGADLHTAQLMPLPFTVSCFSKIQIGFTFLVLAHQDSPGKGPLNGC